MNVLFLNLLLAVAWALATGEFTLTSMSFGFVMGYFILLFARRALKPSRYFQKVPQVLRFAGFYIWELILSNLRVAYDVVTPTHYMRPGVLAVPLDARTDAEIAVLANLITLTPGSLSLDLSADRRVLYVHAMYIDNGDVDAARRLFKDRLERLVLKVLR